MRIFFFCLLILCKIHAVAQFDISGKTKSLQDSIIPSNLKNEVKDKLKLFEQGPSIKINKVNVEANYNYFKDTSGKALGVLNTMNGTYSYIASFDGQIANFPVNMAFRGSNGIYSTSSQTPLNSLSKFNFDHEKYMQSIKKSVMDKLNPEELKNSALNRINAIKKTYQDELTGNIQNIQKKFTDRYNAPLNVPANASTLSATDLTSVRTNFLSEKELDAYKANVQKLSNMSQNKSPQELEKDSAYKNTLVDVKRYEALEQVYGEFANAQQRFQNNATVKELDSLFPFTNGGFKKYLSDPQHLQQVASDNFNMTGLQRLFCNVTTLDLGQNALQSTNSFSFQNIINTGVNTQLQTSKVSGGLTYGKNNTVNNWLHSGLTSATTNEYTNATGVNLGMGAAGTVGSSVMLNSFNFKNTPGTVDNVSQIQSSYMAMLPHKDLVITVHSGFTLGSKHKIEFDVSKSLGSYTNASDSSGSAKQSTLGNLFGAGGKSNFGGLVNYTGEIFNSDVTAFVKKVGLGYSNPGNTLLRSGETQVGIGFAKQLLKRKLTIKYAGDYRNQIFDVNKTYSYSSLNNKLQVGYKITKSDKISFTYQRSDYQSNLAAQATTFGNNSRVQLDASYKFKWKKKTIMNTSILSRQIMNIPTITGQNFANNSLMFTQVSSVVLNKNLLSVSIIGNKSDNQDYYFNTSMFSSEVSYSYTVADKIRLGNSVGYYSNTGWNKQLGINQQISATLLKNMNFDFQIGYKKAIQIIRTELADQLFFNTAIRYNF